MIVPGKVELRGAIPAGFPGLGRYLSLMIIPVLVAGTAQTSVAQDTTELQELKETIKREILQELRSETAPGAGSMTDIEMLKDEIKREILEEFRREQEASGKTAIEVREELKRELRQEIVEDLGTHTPPSHPQAIQYASSALGDAQGQMLRRGIGLAACRVKLVRLLGSSTRFRGYTEDEEYETLTDENGMFHFRQIPEGDYKIKWELPGDSGWIRRLRDEPDLTISSARSSIVKAIETARPLVPR